MASPAGSAAGTNRTSGTLTITDVDLDLFEEPSDDAVVETVVRSNAGREDRATTSSTFDGPTTSSDNIPSNDDNAGELEDGDDDGDGDDDDHLPPSGDSQDGGGVSGSIPKTRVRVRRRRRKKKKKRKDKAKAKAKDKTKAKDEANAKAKVEQAAAAVGPADEGAVGGRRATSSSDLLSDGSSAAPASSGSVVKPLPEYRAIVEKFKADRANKGKRGKVKRKRRSRASMDDVDGGGGKSKRRSGKKKGKRKGGRDRSSSNLRYSRNSSSSFLSNQFGWGMEADEITFRKRLASGAYGEVYRGEWQGTDVAVKRLKANVLEDDELAMFANEVDILLQVRHPNVLLFMGACFEPPEDVFIVTELMASSLYDLLHRKNRKRETAARVLSTEDKINIVTGVARGMLYLHLHRPHPIVHRDLKSPNVLMGNDLTPKVADFGTSKIRERLETNAGGLMNTLVGSPFWMAPEVLRGEAYDKSVDVYSFAIVLYEVLYEMLPYGKASPMAIMRRVGMMGARPNIPNNDDDGDDASEPLDSALADWIPLMEACWHATPSERPPFDEILETLRARERTGEAVEESPYILRPKRTDAQAKADAAAAAARWAGGAGAVGVDRRRNGDGHGAAADRAGPLPILKPSRVGGGSQTVPSPAAVTPGRSTGGSLFASVNGPSTMVRHSTASTDSAVDRIAEMVADFHP